MSEERKEPTVEAEVVDICEDGLPKADFANMFSAKLEEELNKMAEIGIKIGIELEKLGKMQDD